TVEVWREVRDSILSRPRTITVPAPRPVDTTTPTSTGSTPGRGRAGEAEQATGAVGYRAPERVGVLGRLVGHADLAGAQQAGAERVLLDDVAGLPGHVEDEHRRGRVLLPDPLQDRRVVGLVEV